MRYHFPMDCHACHSAILDDAAYCPHCGTRQAEVPECATFDYAAFISYRHREPDASVAARVHKALETYRLPREVAARYGAPKLGRVFRDADELPTTGSLPASIREALRHSRSLVVVCSAATPGSRWVEQEIEIFASYHGRDRVFAVLAEGSSTESLPESLRSQVAAGPDAGFPQRNPDDIVAASSPDEIAASGLKARTDPANSGDPETPEPPEPPAGPGHPHASPVRVPAEPLAADMRAAAASRFNQEKLRLIAGIVGCGFDDLRQRERTRTRKRIAAGILAALAIAAVIGAFALQASQQHQSALVEESQRLAAESTQLLEHGDRYQAIETALQALPSSGSDTSRPLVPEAQEALEAALEIHPDPSTPWRSSYSLETENALGLLGGTSIITESGSTDARAAAIAVCDDPAYFAVSDDAGQVNTYDLLTGAHLATCTAPGIDEPL